MTSDGEGFLSRWSRRKSGGRAESQAPEPVEPSLPPVDELGAGSDYTAFLQKGVTAALQAQALGKAWTSDPAIAGFRGMADYDWDFNAAGYGRLAVADNVPKLLQAIIGPPPNAVAGSEVSTGPDGSAPSEAPLVEAEPAEAEIASVRLTIAAVPGPISQTGPAEQAAEPSIPPRRHGSALPA